MGAKQLTYSDEARQKLLAGVGKLARAVRSTLGPRGRNAVLDKGWGSHDRHQGPGVTVAEEIELKDPYENYGRLQLVKEAASKTSDVAGDGTTTATVLAEAIYREGLKMIAAGHDPMALTRGIHKGVEKVVEELAKMAEKIDPKDNEQITQVATIASNNNAEIGKKLAEGDETGFKAADGVITIEEGKTAETEVVVVQGMQFDRGYLSPHFSTNQGDQVHLRAGKSVYPHLRGEDQLGQEPDSAARDHFAEERPPVHHRGRHRRRRAGHAGAEQAQGYSARLCGQGPGLRRSPQGHARRHRRADRRPGHLQGPGHSAGERRAEGHGPGEEGQDRRREHDYHGRGRRQEIHRRPLRNDSPRAEDDRQRIRPRKAARAVGQAGRRRGSSQGRRRDRD